MFTAMFTRVVSGETSSDAIWHNKIPVALSEPAVDIDKIEPSAQVCRKCGNENPLRHNGIQSKTAYGVRARISRLLVFLAQSDPGIFSKLSGGRS